MEDNIKRQFENIYMKIVHIRAILGLGLGLISILAVILSYLFQQYSVLILSVQAVLLTMVYSVGNIYIENRIKEDYEGVIDEISEKASKLNNKYYAEHRKVLELQERKRR